MGMADDGPLIEQYRPGWRNWK